MNTPAGDYAFYQLALVSGLQKDYTGKITLLNRLVGKCPSSPYAVNALYEKGRSYVLMDSAQIGYNKWTKELLDRYPESPVSRKAAAEIGLMYYQKEDFNHAIEAYKHVIEKYPGSEGPSGYAQLEIHLCGYEPHQSAFLRPWQMQCRGTSASMPTNRIH